MTRFLVLAQGSGERWVKRDGSLPLGTPKHLIEGEEGEPVLHRTVRLLRERGARDVVIVGPSDSRYQVDGAHLVTLDNPHPTGTSMDKLFATKALWGAGRTTILWGDVFYTPHCMDVITTIDSPEPHLVRRPGPSNFTGARWDESFAYSFLPEHHERILELAALINRRVPTNKIHMFTLLAAWNGSRLPPNVREVAQQPNQTHVDDFSDDFDRWSEYTGWLGRYHRPNLAICVASGGDDEHRIRAENWTTKLWEDAGFPVAVGAVGLDEYGRYNVSAARNRAASHVDPDVYVFADGDTFAEPHQVRAAAVLAERTGCLVQAYDVFARLNEPATAALISGQVAWPDAKTTARFVRQQAPRSRTAIGGLVAIPRGLWETVGGYDERFFQWGGEDRAMWCAATTIAGRCDRVAGTGLHLWHPPSPHRQPSPERKKIIELATRYKAAAGYRGRMGALPATREAIADRNAMIALLSEPGGPLDRSTK